MEYENNKVTFKMKFDKKERSHQFEIGIGL